MRIKNHQILSFSLGLFFIGLGCGGAKKTFTIKEFVLLDSKLTGYNNDINLLTASKNGEHLYFTANGNKVLYYAKAEDVAGTAKKIELKTGFSGDPGLATLATAKKVMAIDDGMDGAMVSVQGEPAAGGVAGLSPDDGVFYIKGDTKTAAWSSRAADVGAANIGSAVANKIIENFLIFGYIIPGKNGDVPYVLGFGSGFNLVGVTKADLSPGLMDLSVTRNNAEFEYPTQLTKSDKHLFMVNSAGVSLIEADLIGKKADFPAVALADAANANGTVGASSFKMTGAKDNNTVNTVEAVGDSLYIGLGAAGALTGGVVKYEFKSGSAPVVTPPSVKWNNIGVIQIIKDENKKLFAVTKNDIFEILPSGDRGESYFDQLAKGDEAAQADGYIGTFPREKITGAQFVKGGEQLVIAADGFYVVRETVKPLVEVSK